MAKRDADRMQQYRDAAERLKTLERGSREYGRDRNVVKTIGREYGLNFQSKLGEPKMSNPERRAERAETRENYSAAVEKLRGTDPSSKAYEKRSALVEALGKKGGFNYQARLEEAKNAERPGERLSPGVYRGSQGSLMTPGGQKLPSNPNFNQQQIDYLTGQVNNEIGRMPDWMNMQPTPDMYLPNFVSRPPSPTSNLFMGYPPGSQMPPANPGAMPAPRPISMQPVSNNPLAGMTRDQIKEYARNEMMKFGPMIR
jgi:hypothetical protein